MEFLKELFENGALTFDQFSSAVAEKGFKIADLSTGNYVSKRKYEDDIKSKEDSINDLQGQISTRDTDIKNLKTQLESGADTGNKLQDALNKISTLEADYATAKDSYEKRISAQAYKFSVQEFANAQKFTSKAAKRDFVNEMIAKNLKMKGSELVGADDFTEAYKKDNPDAFIIEKVKQEEPEFPSFVSSTNNASASDDNPFLAAFNFTGVRPHDEN